jgi:hypothetical protein
MQRDFILKMNGLVDMPKLQVLGGVPSLPKNCKLGHICEEV